MKMKKEKRKKLYHIFEIKKFSFFLIYLRSIYLFERCMYVALCVDVYIGRKRRVCLILQWFDNCGGMDSALKKKEREQMKQVVLQGCKKEKKRKEKKRIRKQET